MNDLIERQAAIDALKEHRDLFCDNTPDTFSVLPYGDKCRVDELDMAIATLINLPSAQPEPSQVARDIATIIENEKDMRVIAQPECKTDHGYMWLCPNCGLVVHSDYGSCVRCGWTRQSAQPELPEWAQKVEEYRQNAPQHIHNPLAWALYQVWKEV